MADERKTRLSAGGAKKRQSSDSVDELVTDSLNEVFEDASDILNEYEDKSVNPENQALIQLRLEYNEFRIQVLKDIALFEKQCDTLRIEVRTLTATKSKMAAEINVYKEQLKNQQIIELQYTKNIQSLVEQKQTCDNIIANQRLINEQLANENLKMVNKLSSLETCILELQRDNTSLVERNNRIEKELALNANNREGLETINLMTKNLLQNFCNSMCGLHIENQQLPKQIEVELLSTLAHKKCTQSLLRLASSVRRRERRKKSDKILAARTKLSYEQSNQMLETSSNLNTDDAIIEFNENSNSDDFESSSDYNYTETDEDSTQDEKSSRIDQMQVELSSVHLAE